VADSTPIGEYQETLNKSRALLMALEAAHQSKGGATAVAARVKKAGRKPGRSKVQ
jgi:hypothetical protein